MEFKIPSPIEPSEAWQLTEWVVDILFWADLILNFFFTYRDRSNHEITSLRKIAWNYLTGFFLLNLIACLPENAVTFVVNLFTGDADESDAPGINQATRMARLQRISRLTRLGRLTRLAKMAQFISKSPVMRWLRGLRGMRITNFIVGLLWVVHLIACGWYLCASLHADHDETWVARRSVDTNGTISLLEKGPFEQWCHAVYFVLTVFTTVGFGDMSATTTGEIVYVCFTMILGAVINSIIVSEVINIVTSVDREQVYRTKQKELISAFSTHTELDLETRIEMERWIDNQSIYMDYDEEGLKRLLTNGCLPRHLMADLPSKLFAGKLLRNNFVKICRRQVRQLPPRFPVLMALKVYQRVYNSGEYVYHYSDQPYHVFLVMRGTFAAVATPGTHGGLNVMHAASGMSEDGTPSYFHIATWNSTLATLAAKVGLSKPDKHGKGFRRQESGDDGFMLSPMLHRADLLDMSLTHTSSAGKSSPNGGNRFNICPYMLHSAGSFFGDVELMENKPRRSSVRCEKVDSALLVLHKQDLIMLMNEFPHFGRAWKARARRHERRQTTALESCKVRDHSKSCGELAATQIARMFRLWRAEGGLSRCAKRSVTMIAQHDDGSDSSSEAEVQNVGSMKMPTPFSAFVSNVALTAHAHSSAKYGVNSNGEVLTNSHVEGHDREILSPTEIKMTRPESNPEIAMIHQSIAEMGNQIRGEMHSSIAELKESVDELRRCLAPASMYRKRSPSESKPRKSQNYGVDHLRRSQRRRPTASGSMQAANSDGFASPDSVQPCADTASASKSLSTAPAIRL